MVQLHASESCIRLRPEAAKKVGILWEAFEILAKVRRFARFRSQGDFSLNQFEKGLWIGEQCWKLGQIMFDKNALAKSPAVRLIGTDVGN